MIAVFLDVGLEDRIFEEHDRFSGEDGFDELIAPSLHEAGVGNEIGEDIGVPQRVDFLRFFASLGSNQRGDKPGVDAGAFDFFLKLFEVSLG